MFNWPTDTDSTGPIQPGVGGSDRPVTDLRQVSPNWLLDGHGIRGPQRPAQDTTAKPFPIELGQDTGRPTPAAPTVGACQPTARDPEETGTFVWGSVDGVCQWIDTTECPP